MNENTQPQQLTIPVGVRATFASVIEQMGLEKMQILNGESPGLAELNKFQKVLKDLGIKTVTVNISGGGDSGDVSDLFTTPEEIGEEYLNKIDPAKTREYTQVVPRKGGGKETVVRKYETTNRSALSSELMSMLSGIYPGWEIDDGSYTSMEWDVETGNIEVEITPYEEEEVSLTDPKQLPLGKVSDITPELYAFCKKNGVMLLTGEADGDYPGYTHIRFDSQEAQEKLLEATKIPEDSVVKEGGQAMFLPTLLATYNDPLFDTHNEYCHRDQIKPEDEWIVGAFIPIYANVTAASHYQDPGNKCVVVSRWWDEMVKPISPAFDEACKTNEAWLDNDIAEIYRVFYVDIASDAVSAAAYGIHNREGVVEKFTVCLSDGTTEGATEEQEQS